MQFSISQYADISPDLYKNELRPEWGVNYKYNGLVHHNLDRVWVVTKFPIPREQDIYTHGLKVDTSCSFLWNTENNSHLATQRQTYKEAMASMCKSMEPYIKFLQKKEKYLRNQVSEFYVSELYRALPDLEPTGHRQKRSVTGLITALSGLVTVGVEALSSHLQRKRQEAMYKA